MSDYRSSLYCKPICDISEKKRIVKNKILTKHPKARDMHNYVSDNSSIFKKEFLDAYSNKCGYCGVPVDFVGISNFEIDHFFCLDLYDTKCDAGQMDNLVSSCKLCNRLKSDILLDNSDKRYFHPDEEYINNIFERDEEYYIVIKEEFKSNEKIFKFYQKLEFASDFHRIDYIVMNLTGLISKFEEDERLLGLLSNIKNKIISKRNKTRRF